MNTDAVAALERRVRALETANLRLRSGLTVAVLVVAAFALMGSGGKGTVDKLEAKTVVADKVQAAELVVTSSTGTVRATIRSRTDGRPGLEIKSPTNKIIFKVE